MVRYVRFTHLTVLVTTVMLCWAPLSFPQSRPSVDVMESVRGQGCYRYGDNETPAQAKRTAIAVAQEQAVRSSDVFVQTASSLSDARLEEDLVQTASATILTNVRVEKEKREGQEICVTITASISPASMKQLINQRVNAKEIADEAESAFATQSPPFGLHVWTNRADGRFVEGEQLIIYLESERPAYVKIDYFQADGSVVHLVPNLYRGQSFIESGHRYAFGDETGPETFIIQGPFGAESIKVIASPRPFRSSTTPSGLLSDSRAYLRGLRKGSSLLGTPEEGDG